MMNFIKMHLHYNTLIIIRITGYRYIYEYYVHKQFLLIMKIKHTFYKPFVIHNAI